MPSVTTRRLDAESWWENLGLEISRDRLVRTSAERALRELVPLGFSPQNGGAPLSLKQVSSMIDVAQREAEQQRVDAAIERRAVDLAEFESAFTLTHAGDVVTHGRWSGLTWADATAWCWNLFHYEPRGLVHPGSQLRAEALTELRSGGLPEVFGIPERARELISNGLTPRLYRQHREELGSAMFDPADVRHG